MMPCSDGNSPTMAVSRSALASCAARRASASSSGSMPAARVPARAVMRALLASMVPSRFWKTMPCSSRQRSESGCLRSSLKKNRPSSRRARSTRSCPLAASRRSSMRVLLTATNSGSRRPSAPATGKYFWCSRIEVTRASSGSCRNFSSKRPQMPNGCSTRLVTVSSSPSCRTGRASAMPACSRTACCTASTTRSRRSAGSTMTKRAARPSR